MQINSPEHVAELDRNITEVTVMRDALLDLAKRCYGDGRAECPILSSFAGRPLASVHLERMEP